MGDNQRIHPLHHDLESPPPPLSSQPLPSPEAPLVPRGASKSDGGDPASVRAFPPPPQRTLPAGQMKPPKKRRSCLCRCMCWTVLVLVITIVIIAATVGILWLVFQPKLPKYSIDQLQITRFNMSSADNDSLSAAFDVTITARNPNEKIGIYYEDGSNISVSYAAKRLCDGALPKFYQGHENTTRLLVSLTGQTSNATWLLTSLQQEQQQTGHVPLELKVDQPVKIKFGALKLPKMKFRATCDLKVNTVSANDVISISDSKCKFKLRL